MSSSNEQPARGLRSCATRSYSSLLRDKDFFTAFVEQNTPLHITGVPLNVELAAETFSRAGELSERFGKEQITVAAQQPGKPDKWLEDAGLWDEDHGVSGGSGAPGTITKILAVAARREQMSLGEFFADENWGRFYADGAGCLDKCFPWIAAELESERMVNITACSQAEREPNTNKHADERSADRVGNGGGSDLDQGNIKRSIHLVKNPDEEDATSLPSLIDALHQSGLQLRNRDLWLGGGTLSRLHYDNYENLFLQVVGRKTVTLLPPLDEFVLQDDAVKLVKRHYVRRGDRFEREPPGTTSGRFSARAEEASASAGAPGNCSSRANPPTSNNSEVVRNYSTLEDWRAERGRLRLYEPVEIGPGEMLYIPFGWWHEVVAEGFVEEGTPNKFLATGQRSGQEFATGEGINGDESARPVPEAPVDADTTRVVGVPVLPPISLTYTSFYEPLFCRAKGVRGLFLPNPKYHARNDRREVVSESPGDTDDAGDDQHVPATLLAASSLGSSAVDHAARPTTRSTEDQESSRCSAASNKSSPSSAAPRQNLPPAARTPTNNERADHSEAAVSSMETKLEASAVSSMETKLEAFLDDFYCSGIIRVACRRFLQKSLFQPDAARVRKWVLLKLNHQLWRHGIANRVLHPDNIPDLRSLPVWSVGEFPWFCELERRFPAIRAEVLGMRGRTKFQPYRDPAPSANTPSIANPGESTTSGVEATCSGAWNVLYLFLNHKRFEACDDLPETVRAIEEVFPNHYHHAFVSALTPGTDIIPHFGPNNKMLRVWLPLDGCQPAEEAAGRAGLEVVRVLSAADGDETDETGTNDEEPPITSVPEPQAKSRYPVALRVGDRLVNPRNGRAFAWDHSYRHSAWNFSEATRLVLIVDIWHPDLSHPEIKFLTALQNSRLRVGRALVEEMAGKGNAEADNTLFSIVERNKNVLTEDEWWVVKAEQAAERQ